MITCADDADDEIEEEADDIEDKDAELRALKEEADMSVEELKRKYYGNTTQESTSGDGAEVSKRRKTDD